ncbi:hypothetical protein LR48_Vigan02g129300 [Vigna angularis]|uniref:Auxin-induced protein n=2 Tax=Phaseolus angularis TaxID=3914 RepID=A0A0L9TX23_PHAAN|nr:auxin-responsive protein IAA11 isoform X2 [Vigna angularis]KAG2402696.1 Auxin-responsive protein [Vigna angularis]KOM35143.1 hypothetical protein LR48_Vigan02g129300 [Vigna angularis]BAT95471.1 hypothetical protein VIGAN_08220600 [Vigna angularis var. angularis]
MSTVSKDDNLVLSSEDSSCPEESEIELGLGLSISGPSKSYHHVHAHAPSSYARIFTARAFPSSPSPSPSPSSSSSSSPNITAGTKRAAESLVANNRPGQVVGWPPLRTYRVNSYNIHAKSTEVFNSVPEKSKGNNTVVRKSADNGNGNNINAKEKRQLRSSLFVKVNMDGIPIGRKVDLSAHSSYETLAQTLDDMFNESTTVTTCKGANGEDHGIIIGGERHSKLLDGSSKFVLTYEDKEGDWMLVGDVPWGMFLSSVRRLRIMRTSEANGLAPRFEENIRQKCKPI